MGVVLDTASDNEIGGIGPRKAARRISSGALFEDRLEIIIDHQGEEYRLRITKSGKLILTK